MVMILLKNDDNVVDNDDGWYSMILRIENNKFTHGYALIVLTSMWLLLVFKPYVCTIFFSNDFAAMLFLFL